MQNILYLASQSPARKKLLDIAHISYKIIEHESDECAITHSDSFDEYVLAIARHKIEHAVLPVALQDKNHIFLLTADTLVQTPNKQEILGKPTDRDDAERMLGLLRKGPAELVTGCCLEKKKYTKEGWQTIDKRHWTTSAQFEFHVPKDKVDEYYRQMPEAMHACGGSIIERYGLNFLRSINGSPTTIIGIPLPELHKNLSSMAF